MTTANAMRSAVVVAADIHVGQKSPTVVDVERTLPIENPQQVGTALAGLSAALVAAVDGADDISLEIDANANGVRYRFRSYRRSAR
ncbi:hypothetical protein ACFSOZ_30765 [Mesorhizobium newzealandense]|uniref:Uncharacterized protein n=1 Tax=Mesorhizobium newzealandense TaxID=1300302 RepID=A0ABW4UJU8_9HYPH